MKTHLTGLRIPSELYQTIKERAAKENRTVTGMILHALITFFK